MRQHNAQLLNKQQHKPDITQQQQNTKLTEIQKPLTTLQQKITETQDTQRLQQTLINMINTLRSGTEDTIEKVKGNVGNIAIYVAQSTAKYLTDITDKLNEHIKHVEDCTYRISPEILTQTHT